MNIEYIWIDSLCIVQGDRQDWEQEAAKMASLYENSFLTIAAVDSPNGNGGLSLDSITPAKHVDITVRADPDGATTSTKKFTAYIRQLLHPQSNEDKLHLYNAPLY